MTKNLHISKSIFFFYFVLEFMIPLSVAFAHYFSLSYYGLVYKDASHSKRFSELRFFLLQKKLSFNSNYLIWFLILDSLFASIFFFHFAFFIPFMFHIHWMKLCVHFTLTQFSEREPQNWLLFIVRCAIAAVLLVRVCIYMLWICVN